MTVKMMLNDKSSIEELAKDPEVQIRIKDAIVDEVAKRAAKAAQAALDSAIETAVKLAMDRFLRDNPNDVVRRISCWGDIALSNKMMTAIQNAVDVKLTRAAFDYAEKLPENEELKKAIKRQVDYANEVDVDKMIRESVDRIVAQKFGGR